MTGDISQRVQMFAGRLGVADQASHVVHDFAVAPGTGTLRISLAHSPGHPGEGKVAHQLSISVYGPDGPRGTRHNAADQSPVISRAAASPGYMPGAIEPGAWRVEIDVHRILPPGEVDYRLEIRCDPDELPAASALPEPAPQQQQSAAGWFRGDLHGHTHHSDGAMSVAEYVAYAQSRGQDFVSLTDHNTASGLRELDALAGTMAAIGGVELTTFHGHALALGTRDWQEWRITDGRTMAQSVCAHMAAGHVFVIAHPMQHGHPWCTGCTWAYADVWPGPARHVEVWNGPWMREGAEALHNVLGLKLYHHWLMAGHRLVATAGSDLHRPWQTGVRAPQMGIRAESLSEPALLAGLQRGHAYLTSGPELRLDVHHSDGTTGIMGDLFAAGKARLTPVWSAVAEGSELRVLVDSEPVLTCAADSAMSVSLDHVFGARAWALAELRGPANELLAMTNPVFFGDWA
ncbi:CehA/McbA family metallohydrolase [Roseinatronobacter sp. S2]|uniref:CehA/McbA family metallohydrolase n=1 Tax=Roseinatronobacter sp. S2 TaxID=3035471 RepID=UPI00240FC53F|nr:CehA/McbA family metallohydrolase [Roseinatronobacter sp. S2]WFE77079.1 CehA/McbA family metallohydrolase [Roseinatronobacter sp. S2]